ncbi:hypothetical protein H1C71_027523, partial [Ictidomys tridecemlineatus]
RPRPPRHARISQHPLAARRKEGMGNKTIYEELTSIKLSAAEDACECTNIKLVMGQRYNPMVGYQASYITCILRRITIPPCQLVISLSACDFLRQVCLCL